MKMNVEHDVAVIGGGPAGLSAATALGRSMRSVVVIDSGEPRNAASAAAHNVLSRDGITPGQLRALGRQEAEQYGVSFLGGAVQTARKSAGHGFVLDVIMDNGEPATITARRLLLATGLVDELPDLPGVAEGWGRTVLHCPYCHGWEVRGRRIGVLATTPRSVHQALLFRQLSPQVTYFAAEHLLTAHDREELAARDITVVEGTVARFTEVEGDSGAVILGDGRTIPVDALAVAPRFRARTELYEQLGGTPTEHPGGMGAVITTDPGGRTDIPGVFAAGNTSDLGAMILAAAGSGLVTGAMINADLVAEDVAHAVAIRRDPFTAAAEAANCERISGDHRHGLDFPTLGTRF
jgi:thioredoxin reductase